MSALEDMLMVHIVLYKLPIPQCEFRFAPPRRWRFDFAWPEKRIAVEVDGGSWIAGRHTRGKGFEKDCEKRNAAALDGWRVLHVTTNMVKDGRAVRLIEQAMGAAT